MLAALELVIDLSEPNASQGTRRLSGRRASGNDPPNHAGKTMFDHDEEYRRGLDATALSPSMPPTKGRHPSRVTVPFFRVCCPITRGGRYRFQRDAPRGPCAGMIVRRRFNEHQPQRPARAGNEMTYRRFIAKCIEPFVLQRRCKEILVLFPNPVI